MVFTFSLCAHAYIYICASIRLSYESFVSLDAYEAVTKLNVTAYCTPNVPKMMLHLKLIVHMVETRIWMLYNAHI